MANANSGARAAFVPRTVAAIERGSAALVSRFAAPLRSLADRTLGFVDRTVGVRLLAARGPLVSPFAPAPSRAAALAPSALTFPVPWYPSAAELAGRGVHRAGPPPVAAATARPTIPT